jgi:hypothetical protein
MNRLIASDPALSIITWTTYVTLMCAITDKAGCSALVAVGRIPQHWTPEKLVAAVSAAAPAADRCLLPSSGSSNSSGGGGRKLEAWGKDLVGAPLAQVQEVCKNAAELVSSGRSLPELEKLGVAGTLAAGAVGVSQAVITFAAWLRNPWAGLPTSLYVSTIFGKLFYAENEEDCYRSGMGAGEEGGGSGS